MRFISNTAGLMVLAVPDKHQPQADGWVKVRDKYQVRFEQGQVSDEEIKFAREHWGYDDREKIPGIREGEPVRLRFSSFDSEAIEDETLRETVEKALLGSLNYGVRYIAYEPAKAPAPWANYDKLDDADEIAHTIEITGTEIDVVLAYERENANRPAVIAAVEALRDGSSIEEPVVVEA